MSTEGERQARRVADAAMDRYARGEDAAFGEVYDCIAPRLLAFLTRHTRDREAAGDLLQQCFLQIHAARAHFVPGGEVLPWAFAIARRLMIDSARRRSKAPFVPPSESDEGTPEATSTATPPDEAMGHKQLARRLEDEIARLPEANRAAFELVKRAELSMAEAAEVLGTTVASVKIRAHRAYVTLREALGDEWEEG